MIELLRKHPVPVAISAFVLGAVVVAVIWSVAASMANAERDPSSAKHPPRSSSPPSAKPTRSPTTDPAPAGDCAHASTMVASAAELTAALAAAEPGEVIAMSPGVYDGHFVATVSGTAAAMITLCGTSSSILDGGSTDSGYVFHLDHASYWHLLGFAVTDGQKGVMADGTAGSIIERLTVTRIGDEAIHLRDLSTDNTVTGNLVSDTGHRKPQYGEGIYVGTANSNWCDVSNCRPDNSDRNVIEDNSISHTTAESVDIKEGTSNGILRGNTFDGVGMTAADSWVDVKGNGWTVEGNSGQNSPADGYQVHNVYKGWGTDNVFRSNSAKVNGPGFGFHLAPVQANVVLCSNTASNAGKGLSNVTCSPG
jgi:hypothetical protein